jgi:hypothetical protein
MGEDSTAPARVYVAVSGHFLRGVIGAYLYSPASKINTSSVLINSA